MKLWLDDLRDPMTYDSECAMPTRADKVLADYGRYNWTWVKTVEEAQDILLNNKVAVLSCDNDLGDCGITQGYKLVYWVEEQVYTNDSFNCPPIIYAHSDNVAAVSRMNAAIAAIKKKLNG